MVKPKAIPNPNSQTSKPKGTKRRIDKVKISDNASAAVAYTKRTGGIHSKASQLCLLDGSQMAILATPRSSESHVAFYSFGFPSVDALVSAYLSGQRLGPVPSETEQAMREDVAVCMARRDLGLGFWWEDQTVVSSMTRHDFLHSMSKLLMGIDKLLPNKEKEQETETEEEDFTWSDSVFTDHHHHEASTSDEDQDMSLPQHLNLDGIDHLIGFDTTLDNLLSHQNHASTSAICDTLPNQDIHIPLDNLVSDGFFESLDQMEHFTSTFLMETDPDFLYDSQLIQNL